MCVENNEGCSLVDMECVISVQSLYILLVLNFLFETIKGFGGQFSDAHSW